MAASGERRMVFDIRGRRKHVVRVVYAILALLMGASLFLVVGPVNIGSLLGSTSATSNAAGLLRRTGDGNRKEAEEEPGRREPAALPDPHPDQRRQRAGRSQLDDRSAEGHSAAGRQLEKASEAWSRYLKQAGNEPQPLQPPS